MVDTPPGEVVGLEELDIRNTFDIFIDLSSRELEGIHLQTARRKPDIQPIS